MTSLPSHTETTAPCRAVIRPLLLTICIAAAAASCQSGASTVDEMSAAPPQWYAPLPHGGQLSDLTQWWDQFNDPLLTDLIAAAEHVSPSVASARSRIEQSRAARIAAGAALVPGMSADSAATRGRQDIGGPLVTGASSQFQASWELDLFGRNRAERDASQARLEGAHAAWHDARVSMAAEVANSYLTRRSCEARLVEFEANVASRIETARLTEISARSGMQSPANAALAQASAAQGRSDLSDQRAQCELSVKALVALTGIDEATLRDRLAAGAGTLPQPREIGIAAIPGAVLAQRPDLFVAARDVVAASADIRKSQAALYPSVKLLGSFGESRVESDVATTDGTLWSVGPISVSLPIFDAGARRANVAAARAHYEETSALYHAQLRSAVREVEDALVSLQSAGERANDAREAARGFEISFKAAQARYQGGLGSLFDLEDARRSAVQSRITLIDIEYQRVSSWISLYRALGGGWTPATNLTAATSH
jgi:NodT family efflux transporter outer membrane factor (OMF) lipoprotein